MISDREAPGADRGRKGKGRPDTPKPPKCGPVARVLISLLITIVFGAVYFYFQLPALNFRDEGFYLF